MKIKIIATVHSIILLTISLSAQPPARLSSPSDTLQYSLGVFVGQWMVNNGFEVEDKELFNRGMDDLMMKRPLAVTDSTIVPIITSYQLSIQSERSRQMEEQLFADLKGKRGWEPCPVGCTIS